MRQRWWGAGTMGRGIAMCFANAGIPVHLLGRTPQAAAQARAGSRPSTPPPSRAVPSRGPRPNSGWALIRAAASEADLAAADVVVEAISEELAAKQQLFARLARACHPQAILASNTSFLDLTQLAQGSGRAGQVAGMHFFNPAHAMRLLEIVRTADTTPEVLPLS